MPIACDSCSVESTDLHRYETFGRVLYLCNDCIDKEKALSQLAARDTTPYKESIAGKIEHVIDERTKHKNTVEKWQQLYNETRLAWIPQNFNSVADMRSQLVDFIESLENLEFETKAKRRATSDAARELDARLSKAEREALINDPNFKAPENSQFKKQVKTTRETKNDKAIKGLMALGLSEAEARKQVGEV